jgi:hypothetical protein
MPDYFRLTSNCDMLYLFLESFILYFMILLICFSARMVSTDFLMFRSLTCSWSIYFIGEFAYDSIDCFIILLLNSPFFYELLLYLTYGYICFASKFIPLEKILNLVWREPKQLIGVSVSNSWVNCMMDS